MCALATSWIARSLTVDHEVRESTPALESTFGFRREAGCSELFVDDVRAWLSRSLPVETGGLTEADFSLRVRIGISRAIQRGATSPEAICRFVLLMFVLGPDFDQRSRIRERLAAGPASFDEDLLSLHVWSHPNCWYRLERSAADERWRTLIDTPESRHHHSIPPEKACRCAELEIPRQLSPDYGFQLDVPYFESPYEDVFRMLELAQVGSSDTVMDLGSGDGRIVITAAREFGACGIGVELDPELVDCARRAAERAGVGRSVSFERLDVHDADVSKATVVTMYLLRGVNLALRDRLRLQLKPGSRVVSRHFEIPGWAPHQTIGEIPNATYCWHVDGARLQ